MLFIGSFDQVTNQVAVDWFVTSVWPAVRRAVPSAVFDVVGSRPSDVLCDRLAALPGVLLHADVPALAPHLAAASVAVNPAVTGSGVNIKLIDYLGAGVPVVSTPLAVRGLALRPGVDLVVAGDAAEFAAAVVALVTDPVAAADVARSGHDRITELLDPQRNLDLLATAFLPDAPSSGRPGRPESRPAPAMGPASQPRRPRVTVQTQASTGRKSEAR